MTMGCLWEGRPIPRWGREPGASSQGGAWFGKLTTGGETRFLHIPTAGRTLQQPCCSIWLGGRAGATWYNTYGSISVPA